LIHRAKAALLEVTDKVEWVDLELQKGIAHLSGLVSSIAIKNECEKVILNINGINSVQNQLNVRDEKTTIY
jgi:osmotically-inducible protein OsmY